MLLGHFGESLQKCSGCDYCDDPAKAAAKVASIENIKALPKVMLLVQ